MSTRRDRTYSDRGKYRQIDRKKDREADGQADIHMVGKTVRQTEKKTETGSHTRRGRHTDRQTDSVLGLFRSQVVNYFGVWWPVWAERPTAH